MAITITKTIGTVAGRDYTTLPAWEAGEQGDLVALGEIHRGDCYADSAFTAGVTISGAITDSVNFMSLGPAPGQEHLGVPGAGVVISTTGNNVFQINSSFTVVEGLEIDGGQVNSNGSKQGIRIQGPGSTIRSNIIHGLYANRDIDVTRGIEARTSVSLEIYNNLIYDIKKPTSTLNSTEVHGIKITNDNAKIYHNTIIDIDNPISVPNGAEGLHCGVFAGVVLKNNAVMDTGALDFNVAGFPGVSTNNMDSDGTSVGTLNQQNKLSVNQFVNLAIRDYHLKAGADAINNGTPIAGITTDIAGNIRDLITPDIGAFEFVGGGPIISPIIMRLRQDGY